MTDNVIPLTNEENVQLDAEIVERESPGLVVRCASQIKPEKIDWLWQERLPRGKSVLVAGEGGLGKSMLLASFAATVSRGRDWPCGEGQSPCGSVIILSAEDDAADTIVPRLLAADADCSKVHIVSAVRKEDCTHRGFCLQDDLGALESKVAELGDVLLVIIDPITSYLGRVDSHKNAELRSVLEPLGAMASRCGVTVICNTHLSKASGGSANSRVIGSVAFVNHARAAFIVTTDAEENGRRLFLPSKQNLGKPREGLAYRVAETTIAVGDRELMFAPYVKFEDAPVALTADEAVAAMDGDGEERGAKDEAKEFLLEVLCAGPVWSKEVKRQAEEAGIKSRTLMRAKASLKVQSQREPGDKPRWLWSLPKDANPTPQGCQSQKLASLASLQDFQQVRGCQNGKNAKSANSGTWHTCGHCGGGGVEGIDLHHVAYGEHQALLHKCCQQPWRDNIDLEIPPDFRRTAWRNP